MGSLSGKIRALILRDGMNLSSLRLQRVFEGLADNFPVEILSGERLRVLPSSRVKCTTLPLPCRRERGFLLRFWFTMIAPWIMLNACRRETAIILVTIPWSALLALPAAKLFRRPLVMLLTDLASARQKGARSICERFALRHATKVLVSDPGMKTELIDWGIAPDRVEVVRYPFLVPEIDLGLSEQKERTWEQWREERQERRSHLIERYGFAERTLLLLTFEPLAQSTNVERLLRAVSEFEDGRVALWVCGDGPGRGGLEALRMGLGLSSYVFFVSTVPEALAILGACDVAVVLENSDAVGGGDVRADLGDLFELVPATLVPADLGPQSVMPNGTPYAPRSVEALSERLRKFLGQGTIAERLNDEYLELVRKRINRPDRDYREAIYSLIENRENTAP